MPSEQMMDQALQLDMPMFKLIEEPITKGRKVQRVKTLSTMKNKAGVNGEGATSIELLGIINKEALQTLGKFEKHS